MPKVVVASQASGIRGNRSRRVSPTLSEINVIPLVDVMLVLLIIFMVAAPMLQRGVEVTLPAATQSREISSEPSRALISQQATAEGETSYFRQVYEDFVELKRKCGESTDGLTYDKFAVKLRQNRDQLVQKYACKAVKFQVYVKDGKAALKATPVRG